ncbi:MAG TPA: hypothetical protein VK793_06720 [Steroidobacteraceae bacterium]|nr:hypothetical protein [Steroidobacteraceae bacterium]
MTLDGLPNTAALPNPPDRVLEAIRADRLNQVIHRPFRDCTFGVFGLMGSRDAKRSHRVSREPQDIESGHVGQRYVDEHHIGRQIFNGSNRGATRADFPNNVQIGYLMTQLRQSTARSRLLIDNEKFEGARSLQSAFLSSEHSSLKNVRGVELS